MGFSAHSLSEQVDAVDERCFSLVSKDRTLDLEADSEEMCDEWVKAFQVVIAAEQLEDDSNASSQEGSTTKTSIPSPESHVTGFHTPATGGLSTVEESKSAW
jgi:hypothetical protein